MVRDSARKFWGLAFTALAVGLAGSACRPQAPDTRGYEERIAADRADKDAAFLRQPNEPVPPDAAGHFLPLSYFPIDPEYHVPAVLKASPESPTLMMGTSTGTIEEARRLGQFEFTLKGQQLKLTAFQSAQAGSIWIPFRDLTAGDETYEAGRYIDLHQNATGVYELDFNQAYNPYCYYNAGYICPLPPRENHLDVRIEAGEKVKEK
jgi:uncharacterized protein (DUF1684 family)